jgi:hypothetical protein
LSMEVSLNTCLMLGFNVLFNALSKVCF